MYWKNYSFASYDYINNSWNGSTIWEVRTAPSYFYINGKISIVNSQPTYSLSKNIPTQKEETLFFPVSKNDVFECRGSGLVYFIPAK